MKTKTNDVKKKEMKSGRAKASSAKRVQIKHIRWVVLAAVFLIITIGLILNTNLGTLSSFGWQAIATICPLGALESMLAGRSIFLRALIVLAVVVATIVIFGKFFCSWVCPVAPVRSFRELVRKRFRKGGGKSVQASDTDPVTAKAAAVGEGSGQRTAETTKGSSAKGISPDLMRSQRSADIVTDPITTGSATAAAADTNTESATTGQAMASLETKGTAPSGTAACSSGCSTCSVSCLTKRPKIDSRHVVLGGSLLSAAIFGFPVFCLLCPIGLIFGTVIVAWQFFGTGDPSLSLLIYPVILVLELLVFRTWCGKLCPMGALVSLVSLTNRFFKPVVNRKECIRARGGSCTICSDVCPEGIDPHCADGMNECSKCGLCRDACPTSAITFAPFPKRDAYDDTVAHPLEQERETSLPATK